MPLADEDVHEYPVVSPSPEGDSIVPGVQDDLAGQGSVRVLQIPVPHQTRGLVNHLTAVLTPSPIWALTEVGPPTVMTGPCCQRGEKMLDRRDHEK